MSERKSARIFRSPYVYTAAKAAAIVKDIGRFKIGFRPDFASMESKRLPDGTKIWRVVAYKWAKHAAQ